MAQAIVRIVLSIVLLVEVWRHSHWSVALSITLMFLWAELSAWLVRLRKVKPNPASDSGRGDGQ